MQEVYHFLKEKLTTIYTVSLLVLITYRKSNTKMIFYLRNVVKYYSEVGDIKTIIIRCLKANRKNACLFSNLRCSKLILSFIYDYLIKQLINDKVFMLERICLQF